MKTRFSTLLIAGLAGLMLAGGAMAEPRGMDRDFRDFSSRDRVVDRDYGRQEEREVQQPRRHQHKKDERKAEEHQGQHGYGYGYERRNMPPPPDDRGRR